MADAMELSQKVYTVCNRRRDPIKELKVLLGEHQNVDVNLYRCEYTGYQTIHRASERGRAACVRMLLQHGADVHARDSDGNTALTLAALSCYKECVKLLLEAKADVNAATNGGWTATHSASSNSDRECLQLFIDSGADVNSRTNNGDTPAMRACYSEDMSCLQLLMDNKADLNVRDDDGEDALYNAMLGTSSTSGAPFAVLSCNTDAKNVKIDEEDGVEDDEVMVTEAIVAACIEEYTRVHAYIDEFHGVLNDTLLTNVEVDTRFGLGENGIYQEPLERVLEYMGLSMNKDQVVNTSIDGTERKRALIPYQLQNAEMWFSQLHNEDQRAKNKEELKGLAIRQKALRTSIDTGFALY
jgi:DNA-binding protein YbaB